MHIFANLSRFLHKIIIQDAEICGFWHDKIWKNSGGRSTLLQLAKEQRYANADVSNVLKAMLQPQRIPKELLAWLISTQYIYLWVRKNHIGRVKASQEVRYFHHRCHGVVDAEICKPGTVCRPPVGSICQKHLLCIWRNTSFAKS